MAVPLSIVWFVVFFGRALDAVTSVTLAAAGNKMSARRGEITPRTLQQSR